MRCCFHNCLMKKMRSMCNVAYFLSRTMRKPRKSFRHYSLDCSLLELRFEFSDVHTLYYVYFSLVLLLTRKTWEVLNQQICCEISRFWAPETTQFLVRLQDVACDHMAVFEPLIRYIVAAEKWTHTRMNLFHLKFEINHDIMLWFL